MTPTLHPDDRAQVEQVVDELRGHRRLNNLTAVAVSAKLGRRPETIRAVEAERNRRTGTLQAYAWAVGLRLTFTLDGLPDVTDPRAATLDRAARQAKDRVRRHSFERAALGARIGATRIHLGFTQQEILDRAGRQHSFLSNLEQHAADDPLLATYQVAVRALGGMLRLRLLPDGATDETRLRALLDELADHAQVAAVRYRAVTPVGTVKGITLHDAQLAVAEHGGTVEHSELWMLPGRYEVLGPWLPYVDSTVSTVVN